MNETIEQELKWLKNRAVELGIEGYFDGIGDNEIIVLALYKYEDYLKKNNGVIRADMDSGELDDYICDVEE